MEIWEILDRNRQKTGKTIERGTPMNSEEYHLVVDIWIKNINGDYLITKRTPNKTFPNMWTICGGSAVLGDDSLEAAMREVQEEIGISLSKVNGRLVKSFRRDTSQIRCFKDIWLFDENVNLEDVVHQHDEVSDSMWASERRIREMIDSGEFIGVLSYLDDIFKY